MYRSVSISHPSSFTVLFFPTFQYPIDLKPDCRSMQPSDIEVAEEYRAAAHRARRLFIPVVLTCNVDENARRLESEERGRSDTTKSTDVELLRNMRRGNEL
jgi:hypothetical protein